MSEGFRGRRKAKSGEKIESVRGNLRVSREGLEVPPYILNSDEGLKSGLRKS